MAKAKKGSASASEEKKASSSSAKGKEAAGDAGAKRKLGLRGAAPWAARHAAKHAAELRARAAEPALPGSARATIRTPAGAEDIKKRIADLHNSLVQVKALRKNLSKSFYEIGGILREIQARRLYEAKGYGSFDAFLEREIELGRVTALRLVKVVSTFMREAALEHGMERVFTALAVLELGTEAPTASGSRTDLTAKLPPPPISTASLPLRPPGR